MTDDAMLVAKIDNDYVLILIGEKSVMKEKRDILNMMPFEIEVHDINNSDTLRKIMYNPNIVDTIIKLRGA